MNTVIDYKIDLNKDPKGLIRFVRDDLERILRSPGATNIEAGRKKIRFYNYCLEREDGVEVFGRYADARRAAHGDEEAGFRAVGWKEESES